MPDIWLSDLKFTGIQPASENYSGERSSLPQNPTQASGQPQNKPGAEPASNNQGSYNNLPSDKPGEELAPDASIWRLYADEAKEYDSNLVADRNRNLDTMLLFAGLFSAILTAFLIVSMGMLQENSTETSKQILLRMAQSQWRVETGRPDTSSPPVEILPFKPTTSARWINALWFLALALSLGAAIMAMQAKEWLGAFTESMQRNPYQYALQRQARFDALESWHALQIIDFLPSILIFSLQLFALGLITQLWLLDHAIAMIVASISITLAMSYISVVILGGATDSCPYRTRVSKYIKLFFERYVYSGWTQNNALALAGAGNSIKPGDLRALKWLAENAQDPTVGDKAYQALAGLRSREAGQLGDDSKQKLATTNKSIFEDYRAVMQMGNQIFNWISKSLSEYPRELASCGGANAARYVGVFSGVYSYACECLKQLKKFDDGSIKLPRRLAKLENEISREAKEIKRLAFTSLDTIWSDECPPFTADAYAGLTAAELRLTGAALKEIIDVVSPDETKETASPAHTSINLPSLANPVNEATTSSFNLRARYSRALGRAAVLLRFHFTGRAPVGNLALIDMLEAITELAASSEFGSPKPGIMVTHQPQVEADSESPVVINVIVANEWLLLDPNKIGNQDGLLAGLTALQGSASVMVLPKLDTAAAAAMASVGSKLMNQWVQIQNNSNEQTQNNSNEQIQSNTSEHNRETEGFTYQPLSELSPRPASDPKIPTAKQNLRDTIWSLLDVTHFAISFCNHPGICELPEIALRTLYQRVSSTPLAQNLSYEMIVGVDGALNHWIDSITRPEDESQSQRLWSQDDAKLYLSQLLTIRSDMKETICGHLLTHMEPDNDPKNTSSRLFTILEIMRAAPDSPEEIKKLLEKVTNCACADNFGYYSQYFTNKSDGFDSLQILGTNPNYSEHVAQAIVTLITNLAGKREEGEEWIRADATPGFLVAVSFVCKNPPAEWRESLNQFIPAVVSTLQALETLTIIMCLPMSSVRHLKAEANYMKDEKHRNETSSELEKIETRVKQWYEPAEEEPDQESHELVPHSESNPNIPVSAEGNDIQPGGQPPHVNN